jgi:polyisoprenyl-teichoic acid--peptidoglycan teichoic acid transferase
MGSRKRKHRESLFWLEAAFIVLLLAGAYVIGSYARAMQNDPLQEVFVADHGTNVVEVTDEQGTVTGNELVDYDALISDYRNILLVGVDARDQKRIDRGANADVIMIVSINEKTGKIRLVSVLRDTLLRLEDPGSYHEGRLYDKANSQICYTDIADMISMINRNLDLNIQDYVVLNWLSAAQVVDTLGGIEVSIDNPEVVRYMNGYLTEVNKQTGIWSEQLDGSGTFNLTGTQAVAFCRVRYAGLGDVGRTGNQRMVIEQCLQKVKSLILTKPTTVVRAVSVGMDSIATNLSMLELGNLAFQAGDFEIEESISFPFQYVAGEYLGQIYELTNGVKDAVVAKELADNVIQLHAYLYPEAAYAYQLPEEIQKISEDIAWMSDVRKQVE